MIRGVLFDMVAVIADHFKIAGINFLTSNNNIYYDEK